MVQVHKCKVCNSQMGLVNHRIGGKPVFLCSRCTAIVLVQRKRGSQIAPNGPRRYPRPTG